MKLKDGSTREEETRCKNSTPTGSSLDVVLASLGAEDAKSSARDAPTFGSLCTLMYSFTVPFNDSFQERFT